MFCDPRETTLIFTEAPNAFQKFSENSDQILFEGYEFESVYRCPGGSLVPWNQFQSLFEHATPYPQPAECTLVIDCGYSFTQVTPIVNGKLWQQAVRRIDVGGKFITNFLKSTLSTRHFNLMDEAHIVNEIKEAVCFVSTNFSADLEKVQAERKLTRADAKAEIVVDYMLPDYSKDIRGSVKQHVPKQNVVEKSDENIMSLGNERFAGPELLFNPMDVGLAQTGIPESIMQGMDAVPRKYWGSLMSNVVLTGGTSLLRGFTERLQQELRPLAPDELMLRAVRAPNPITFTWQGGVELAQHPEALSRKAVTKKEYEEHGAAWCARKFAGLPFFAGSSSYSTKRRRASTEMSSD